MKKFTLYTDCAFYALSAFAICFAILRYHKVPAAVALLTALLIAFAVSGLALLYFGRKLQKRLLSRREHEAKEKLMLHLALESPERVRALLLSSYRNAGKDVHVEKDALEVDGKMHVPCFTMEPLNADGVAALLRAYGGEFTLLTNSLTKEAEHLAFSFSVAVERGESVYLLLKETESIPQNLICGNLPRRTKKERLRLAFSKKNARPFFVSGLLLLLMSLFVLFPVYYLAVGCTLVLCAAIVRLFGFA